MANRLTSSQRLLARAPATSCCGISESPTQRGNHYHTRLQHSPFRSRSAAAILCEYLSPGSRLLFTHFPLQQYQVLDLDLDVLLTSAMSDPRGGYIAGMWMKPILAADYPTCIVLLANGTDTTQDMIARTLDERDQPGFWVLGVAAGLLLSFAFVMLQSDMPRLREFICTVL